jgi:DNA ligase (NAD+)
MSRLEAQAKVKERSGVVKESVTKDLDYLVVGNEPGSKLEKARKLNIRIIEEPEFLKLIK